MLPRTSQQVPRRTCCKLVFVRLTADDDAHGSAAAHHQLGPQVSASASASQLLLPCYLCMQQKNATASRNSFLPNSTLAMHLNTRRPK